MRIVIAAIATALVFTVVNWTPWTGDGMIKVSYDELTPKAKQQVDCLAENVYYEAGVEPDTGKMAVAIVTMNRVKSHYFPKTICGVVKERNATTCQFSWWCEAKKAKNWAVYRRSRDIALDVYLNYNKIDDITEGALFYHATYVRPAWKGVEKTTQIGQHIFYRKR